MKFVHKFKKITETFKTNMVSHKLKLIIKSVYFFWPYVYSERWCNKICHTIKIRFY